MQYQSTSAEVAAANKLGKSRNLRVVEKISAGVAIYQIRRGNVTVKTVTDFRNLKRAIVGLL